ncbi:hypothetical protein V5O48_014033 [Marasmius crinis-equi]|uniref:Uncharacterized protein n=1 Tax=Marasmius crinis-equi TaxID=585013 RepID=A0ABR3EYH5_9AGAR
MPSVQYPGLISYEAYARMSGRKLEEFIVYETQAYLDLQNEMAEPGVQLQELYARRYQRVSTETQRANIWRAYQTRFKQRVEQDFEEAREARINQVASRLHELGYEPEVNHLLVTDPDTLQVGDKRASKSLSLDISERAWNSALPELVKLMEKTRKYLVRKQRKSTFKNRLMLITTVLESHSQRFPNEILPSPVDICSIPKVKAMIDEEDLNAYTTLELFAELADELPGLCHEWRASKRNELAGLLPAGSDASRLSLAKTFFKCADCTVEPISYPRILIHECMRTLRFGFRNRDDDDAAIFKALDSEPWNVDGNRVGYYPDAEKVAIPIIRACGMHPDIATPEDLDQAAPWLECPLCRSARGRVVFKWRKAILHGLYHFRTDRKLVDWKLLQSQEDVQRAKDVATTHWERCPSYREDHQITGEAVSEGDYRLSPDASMDQPAYVVIIPPAAPVVIDLLNDSDDDEDDDIVEVRRDPPVITLDEDGLEYIEIVD